MNNTQAKFYLDVLRVYKEKDVPFDMVEKIYNVIFIELSMTGPDELSLEHTELMENAQLHFAELEEFKKADVLKKTRETAFEIFKAREEHLDILKNILKKQKEDDEQAD